MIKIEIKDISTEQIVYYLSLIKSDSARRQAIGTLINVYDYYGMGFKLRTIPYPKKHRELPDYLTPIELNNIFASVKNKKQRTILKLQYLVGAGFAITRQGDFYFFFNGSFNCCFHVFFIVVF